jgi:ATP-binding cassette subfamily C protein
MNLKRSFEAANSRLRRGFSLVAFISILANFCILAIPLYLFQVFDRVIKTRSVETLTSLTIIAVIVLITYGVLDYTRQAILGKLAARFDAESSTLLLYGSLKGNRHNFAELRSHINNIQKFISSAVFPSLFDLPGMVLFILLIFVVHPVLGGVVTAGAAVLLSVALFTQFTVKREVEKLEQSNRATGRDTHEIMRQSDDIRAMGMHDTVLSIWGKGKAPASTDSIAVTSLTASLSALSKALRQVIQIAIIGTGAFLVILGDVTPGIIFAASIIGSRALAPIEALVSGWSLLHAARSSSKILKKTFDAFGEDGLRTDLPRPSGNISIENAIFTPGIGQQPIVRGVHCRIASGECVALIGPSGAGKSTLAKLLIGALPLTAGNILISGQGIGAWDPILRGAYSGYLSQHVTFFQGTVKENIARMRVDDPDVMAIEAAKFVGIHDIIMRLPRGYDTKIDEAGFQLSGGQKQLVGLARAFYGKPAYVVLDEPNANLDSEGEKCLSVALTNAKLSGITVVIVTQRNNVFRHVDKILMLRDGKATDFGTVADVQNRQKIQNLGSKQ